MKALTIYLTSKPGWPVRGFRNDAGQVLIGTPGGYPEDNSRPLQPHEIARLEEG